jgi:hypothetical protein
MRLTMLMACGLSLSAETIPVSIYDFPGWPIYTNVALDGRTGDGYDNEPGSNLVQWIPKPYVAADLPIYVPPVIVIPEVPYTPPVAPIPEPGTLGALAILAGILAWRKRCE